MRKLLLILSAAAVTLLCACSSQDEPRVPDAPNPVESSELIIALQAFNDSLPEAIYDESRGFWETFGDVLYVAAHDIYGAYKGARAGAYLGAVFGPHGATICGTIGGVICGAGASYGAYKMSRSSDIPAFELITSTYNSTIESQLPVANYMPKRIRIAVPDERSAFYTIGGQHNMILYKLVDENYNETTTLNPYLYSDEEFTLLTSAEFKAEYEHILSDIASGSTDIDSENASVADKVVKNYVSALKRSAKDENDVAYITNRYISIYNRSTELTDDEKNQIFGAIGVATASIEFWNDHRVDFITP